MAANVKKEQEREELHRAIWAIADNLRGSVDGWDFKNYVLGTMFYRFISEKLANYGNRQDYAACISFRWWKSCCQKEEYYREVEGILREVLRISVIR